jgi:hypothetical protein
MGMTTMMARGQTPEKLHNFDLTHPYKQEYTSSDDDVKHKWKKGRENLLLQN